MAMAMTMAAMAVAAVVVVAIVVRGGPWFSFFLRCHRGLKQRVLIFREIHEVSPSLELTSMISSTPAVTAVVSLAALAMLASAANRCLRRSIRMETCGME